MKKILVITQTTNTASGWGRYSSEIVNELKNNKLEVFVLEEDKNANSLQKKDSLVSFIKNVLLARRAAENAEIVHVLDGWPYAVYGYLAVLGGTKKLFINAVGTYSLPPQNHFSVKGLLMRVAYGRADKVFSISGYTDKILRLLVPRVNSTVVHLGVDQLPQPSDKSMSLVMSKINSRSPVVLTVGALKKRKGQIYTLKAVLELKKEYPNILYVMVGEDSDVMYRKEIFSYAKENNLESSVLTTGIISDDELSAWYKSSDVFALNSLNHDGHFEGFGLVLLEAASAGVPTVGSMGCGVEDALGDGFSGYYTEQGNSHDIAQKIKAALVQRAVLSRNSIEFSKRFSWGRTVGVYIKHYKGDLL